MFAYDSDIFDLIENPDMLSYYNFTMQKQIIKGLSKFDTSSIIAMKSKFNLNTNIESLDLSNFNTSSVTRLTWMFYGCQSLDYLDITNLNNKYR